jgi:hypothetical protein
LLQLLTTILHRKQTTPNDAATHTFFQLLLLLLLSNNKKTPQDGRNKKEVPPPSTKSTKTGPLDHLLLSLLSNRKETPQDGRDKKKVPPPSTKTTKHDIAQTRGSRPTLQTRSNGGGGTDEPRSWELLLLLLPLLSSLFLKIGNNSTRNEAGSARVLYSWKSQLMLYSLACVTRLDEQA